MKYIYLVLFITFFGLSTTLFGQEHEKANNEHHEVDEEFKHNRLLFEFGYTHIPDGYEDIEGDQDIWVPTFGLSYVYHFNHKWGASLTTNLETAKYQVPGDTEDFTRENVLIISAVGIYEILPNWGVFVGPGIEIEKHHNFAMLRFGTEYIMLLNKNWFITPIFTFDHKFQYTSVEISLGIGKRF